MNGKGCLLTVLLVPMMAAALIAFASMGGAGVVATSAAAQDQVPLQGEVPGGVLGNASDADLWRAIRRGERGTVSLPDQQAGVLIQSDGDNWRAMRNGPLSVYGTWAMVGILAVLALFFALRGRIRIEKGRSGTVVERFNLLERAAHWLMAISFIVLALTGLNILYGRYVLKPLLGAEVFAYITFAGKYAHNYLAFAFMLGLILTLMLWIRDNIPDRHDLRWLAKGGGFFTKGSHPPAKRFNAGQKVIFWLVMLGGISVSLSGIALLFPFEFSWFSKTFAALNLLGLDLPTNLSPVQEMQLSHLWHAIVALFLTVVVIAHIYIGTIGMEGAFDAMSSGKVDRNWAREHHSLWMQELEQSRPGQAKAAK